MISRFTLPLLLAMAPLGTARADWPMWAGTASRNMVANGKDPIIEFNPGKKLKGKDAVDMATTKNLKWVVELGSQSYGSVTVAGGKVLLGTNNEKPFDSKYTGDRSILLCLDEKTGKMVWQLPFAKLGTGKVSDWEYLGLCSTTTIEGDRAYLTTNRCHVVCVDMNGLKNGNDGPFKDEAKYLSSPDNKIEALGDTDGDIIWAFDMRDECGVFPHNQTSSNVLVLEDRVYATTSNGMDWTHSNIPAPTAPSLICLDKKTGALMGEEGSGISKRCLHCSWASPGLANVDGKRQIIFAGGDGFVYGFDTTFKKEDDFNIMNEIWRFDGNPPEYRIGPDGKKKKYADFDGPSEIIATPIFYDGLVYSNSGQDPEHGEGLAMMSCIDPKGKGDLSANPVWTFKGIGRSVSTPSIKDGLIYVAEYSGLIHCLDAKTGKQYWQYDTKGHVWGSTLVVDDKIYIGNEEGELHILQTGKELKEVATIDFPGPLYASPVYANDTLYLMTMSHLYAFAKPGA
ncbi:MAG: pyrrolo-quinoline quinone [Verrucomicrobiaceae bacterium]|nr:MAG: pyrrolo-quinoline quinone [Verrucomicrobiaceae bacterium]